ncbi:translation initiation factor IF-2-like [Gallus gallus]|uniref:translation initiation factor IF-2-like n=1 Tax=Gallus gallus TaxID=9031 RepID=UPI001F0147EB|nr:translation initiation factor IF-2-like [Gallus gallus]XP_046784524.1 translation initiation factor IF-2-like [Gallus gallus]
MPEVRPAPPPRSEGKEPRGCSSPLPSPAHLEAGGGAGIPRQLRAEPPNPDAPPHPPAAAPPRRAAHPRSRRLPPAPEGGQRRAPARRGAVRTYSAGPPWRRRGPGGAPGAATWSLMFMNYNPWMIYHFLYIVVVNLHAVVPSMKAFNWNRI